MSGYSSWIGTDESGKGDYFGPLVVAGVFVDAEAANRLQRLGVRDSKRLSDQRAKELSFEIKRTTTHNIVPIGPQRYNELIEKLGNLNRLLAWGHARVIENILETVSCETVIADQFGDERFIENALMERGKHIDLIQRPKAEADIAVAAASILARAEFLQRLLDLSDMFHTKIPKGSSSPDVESTAVQLVRAFGPNVLKRAVKYHFKTTQRVLASASAS